jgi:hypothetical protein
MSMSKSGTPITKGFTLGRAAFEKISAVEGVRLSRKVKDEFLKFDRKGLSPDERRRAIMSKYAKSTD